jgi:hypothetical protein
MDALDQILWKDLTHAYGSAADVPHLLRWLRTASSDLKGEGHPLWHLFGNIWHQGTVYEATSYAVPFLIELAVDRHTPDRVGVLSLLAEIANGTSYSDVHGNLRKDPDFERKRNRELAWVRQAHDAVAAGFAQFLDLTNESGDVACAAAHVLALGRLVEGRHFGVYGSGVPGAIGGCLFRLCSNSTTTFMAGPAFQEFRSAVTGNSSFGSMM